MPQLGNMKFPYTPAGKQRYQQIKKALGNTKITRPINSVKPKVIQSARKPIDAGFKRVQPINKIRQVQRSSMAAQMDRLRGGGQNKRVM